METQDQPSGTRADLRGLVATALVAALLTVLIGLGCAAWLDDGTLATAGVSEAAGSTLHTLLSIAMFAALTAVLARRAARSARRRDRHAAERAVAARAHHDDDDTDRADERAHGAGAQAGLLVEHYLRLDAAIGEQLQVVITDTEATALSMIKQVRALTDGANTLLGYLGNSDLSANALERQIEGNVASIVEIADFVHNLPAMIRQDVEGIHAAAIRELDGLAGFTAVIKGISDQTNLLAVNAAILAATSGGAQLGFGVVAREMRELSARSAEAATMIEAGLQDAKRTMREGLRTSSMERRILEGAATVSSIRTLQTSYEEVRVYYRLMFKVVTEHNTVLAREIADLLGQFQGQDVVRQRLERVASAMARRNDVLRALPQGLADADLSALPPRMSDALDDFIATEHDHAAALVATGPAAALPKFELF